MLRPIPCPAPVTRWVCPRKAPSRSTRSIAIERKNGALNLLPTKPVGAPATLGTSGSRNVRPLNIVHIPYKGTGPAINALASGEVQLMISTPGGAAGLVVARGLGLTDLTGAEAASAAARAAARSTSALAVA